MNDIMKYLLVCVSLLFLGGCGSPANKSGVWSAVVDANSLGNDKWESLVQDPEVKRRLTSSDSDKDGLPDIDSCTVYKNKKVVFSKSRIHRTREQVRVYYANYGNRYIAAVERDENGDGFYEYLTLYDDDINVIGAYFRDISGNVRPLSVSEEDEIINSGRNIKGRIEGASSLDNRHSKTNSLPTNPPSSPPSTTPNKH